jgi:hypothetical protein
MRRFSYDTSRQTQEFPMNSNVRRCATCGYQLRGLPDAGRCPECGEHYGPDIFIIWGRHGGNVRSRTWPLVGMVLSVLYMVSIGIYVLATYPGGTFMVGPLVWGAFGFFISSVGFIEWHARISAKGYGMRRGAGPVTLRPWKGDEEIDLTRRFRDSWVLTVRDNLNVPLRMAIYCNEAEVEDIRQEVARLTGRRVGLEK